MKTSLKLLMPVLAFALASAGAVKTEVVKKAEAKLPPIAAYVQNGSVFNCTPVTANCSTIDTHITCMSIEQTSKRAWLKNNSDQCSVELFKVQ